MTTSQTPWTSKLAPEGHTIISDAAGNEIGTFKDHRDGDMVVEIVSDRESLPELRDKIEILEQADSDNDETIEEQDKEITSLEKRVEELQAEVENLKGAKA